MSSPLVTVLCTTLLVLCVGGGVHSDTVDHPQIVDSVKLVVVSKQDDDGKWVNEVKLEHGNELAPWKVEVEQKTVERGGRQSVELSATLTGSKPAPESPTAAPLFQGMSYPRSLPRFDDEPFIHYGSAKWEESVFEELRTSWRGSQYTVHPTEMDWVTANKTCADAGSYLAIINSEEEATFFTQMLNQLPGTYQGAFVGITDEGQEGNWVTVEGVPISNSGYNKWYSNDQPSNGDGNENCGLFFPWPRGFDDVPCTGYFAKSICEKDDEATIIEDPLRTLIRYFQTDETDWADLEEDYYMMRSEEKEQKEDDESESEFKKFTGFSSFYKVQTKQMDWETANKTCVEEGAHLAVINSEEEAMMLASLLNRFYRDAYRGAFVGITDEAEEGTWLTIFGETTAEAGFARWFRNDQPDNANGNENCGAIYPVNGGFNDVPCTEYLMHSICEKDENTETAVLESLESDSQDRETTPEPEEIESKTETSKIDESIEMLSFNEMTTDQNDFTTTTNPTLLGYERHSNLHFYKLHLDTDKNWHEAQLTCEMEGAVLAEVEPNGEFEFLVNLLVQSPLAGSNKVFTGFGNKKHVQGYPFDSEYDDNDAVSDTEMCEAIDASDKSMAIVHCYDRLPFICEINQIPDLLGENFLEAEASKEFDNTVDLPNSLSNSDERMKGDIMILNFISQQREGVMTPSQSSAEVDYEEILPWANTEAGRDYSNEYLIDL